MSYFLIYYERVGVEDAGIKCETIEILIQVGKRKESSFLRVFKIEIEAVTFLQNTTAAVHIIMLQDNKCVSKPSSKLSKQLN